MSVSLSRRPKRGFPQQFFDTFANLQSQKRYRKIINPIIAIAIFLVIWQMLTMSPDSTLPSPIKVIQETWILIGYPFYDRGDTDKGLFWQIFASLQRVAIGYSLAAIVGVVLGLVIGASPVLHEATDPIVQVLRTIPPLAWLPISLAAFQQSNPSAIFVIFITSLWPIMMNTIVGVQQIPQDYVNVSKVLQLTRKEYFFQIVIPATIPYIFTGLRIGVGLSWLAIIAAEMLVGVVGIGFFIWDSYNAGRLSAIILALLYIGVVGLMLDRLVAYIGSLVVPEQPK